MKTYAWYFLAAFAEIGGCFAFWAWLRLAKEHLVGRAGHVLARAIRLRPDENRFEPRGTSLRGLWRHLHRVVTFLAVGRREGPTGPMGCFRSVALHYRIARDSLRSATSIVRLSTLFRQRQVTTRERTLASARRFGCRARAGSTQARRECNVTAMSIGAAGFEPTTS